MYRFKVELYMSFDFHSFNTSIQYYAGLVLPLRACIGLYCFIIGNKHKERIFPFKCLRLDLDRICCSKPHARVKRTRKLHACQTYNICSSHCQHCILFLLRSRCTYDHTSVLLLIDQICLTARDCATESYVTVVSVNIALTNLVNVVCF